MEATDERALRNEALFREANERIERVRDELAMDERTPYICECSRPECTQIVRLAPAEYRAVRAHGRRFLQVPGHAEGSERVIEEFDGYVVVEKTEPSGEG